MASAKTKRLVFFGPSGAYDAGEYQFEKDGHSVEVPEDVAQALLETHGEIFEEASAEVLAEEKKEADAKARYEAAIADAQKQHDADEEDAAAARESFYLGHKTETVPDDFAEPETTSSDAPESPVTEAEESKDKTSDSESDGEE